MLIRLMVERLRTGMDGEPFTLCGDRVFGALSPEDVIRRFESEPPFCVVAPLSETATPVQAGTHLDRQEIRRDVVITAVLSRPESDDVVGAKAADDAELLRDQLMAAFLDWRPACSISTIYYSGLRIIDMPGRAAVAYTFVVLEDYDHDSVRAMMYDGAEKLELAVNVRGAGFIAGRGAVPPCED